MLKKVLHALWLLALSTTLALAAETTQDGRAFQSLNVGDVEALDEADKQAYRAWELSRQTEQSQPETSSYQESEGPNTMDISSDFSM